MTYRSKGQKEHQRALRTAKVIERHRDAAMPYDDSNDGDDDHLTSIIQGYDPRELTPLLHDEEKIHGKSIGKWSDRSCYVNVGYHFKDGATVVFQKKVNSDIWNKINAKA